MKCEYCGAVLPENATECPSCGAALSAPKEPVQKSAAKPFAAGVTCKQCGKVNASGSTVCVSCGSSLKSAYVCTKCGKFFKDEINFCNACGGQTAPVKISPYSYKIYLLCSFLLGEFGAHFFYSRRKILAIVDLVISLFLLYILIVGHCDVNVPVLMGYIIIYLINIGLAFFIKTDGKGRRMI